MKYDRFLYLATWLNVYRFQSALARGPGRILTGTRASQAKVGRDFCQSFN